MSAEQARRVLGSAGEALSQHEDELARTMALFSIAESLAAIAEHLAPVAVAASGGQDIGREVRRQQALG